jgi:hypothetical protein
MPRTTAIATAKAAGCAMGLNGKNLNNAERDSIDINVSAFVMGPALSLASCSPSPTPLKSCTERPMRLWGKRR